MKNPTAGGGAKEMIDLTSLLLELDAAETQQEKRGIAISYGITMATLLRVEAIYQEWTSHNA